MASHGVPRVLAAADRVHEKEEQRIREYRDLVSQVNKKVIDSSDYGLDSFDLTSKLLVLNPEYYTIWNYRRLLLQHEIESLQSTDSPRQEIAKVLTDELRFLFPLLKQFPKCYWIWNHRAWLLQQTIVHLDKAVARTFWEQELGLVGKMLSLDNRNFHGWGYRRKVVKQLESIDSEDCAVGKSATMTQEELDYTTKMIKTNLSNFSAWHNRSKLIPKLLDEQDANEEKRWSMLEDEFKLIQRALWTDPYDQSLWFYYQALMGSLDPDLSKFSIVPNSDREKYRSTVKRELENLKELRDEAEDSKYVYQALIEYTLLLVKLDGTAKDKEKKEMTAWLAELQKLDPLRRGRWDDLAASL